MSWAKIKLSQKLQFILESKFRLKLQLKMEFSYQPGWWVEEYEKYEKCEKYENMKKMKKMKNMKNMKNIQYMKKNEE